MKDARLRDGAAAKEAQLPWRDWILLPVLGLLTISIVAVSLDRVARFRYRTSTTSVANCIVRDPSAALQGIPNSMCLEKAAESQPVEYRFNGCGHRTGMECGPKAPDHYRIVMTGSSFAMGAHVEIGETLGALLPVELSLQTGQRVELYNEGLSWRTPRNVSLDFRDVLTAQPDMILWILTPWDIDGVVAGPAWLADRGSARTTRDRVKQALLEKPLRDAVPEILDMIRERWMSTASAVMVQHYLYESQSEYVKLYLRAGRQGRFMRTEPGLEWQNYMEQFDRDAADILQRARARGIPLVAVLVPNRAQAAMISMGEWPAGYDPYKLGEEIRAIVTNHGGIYIDILQDFRTLPNPERYYFPVDGHLNARGNAVIAGLLAKELTSGSIPALSIPVHLESAREEVR